MPDLHRPFCLHVRREGEMLNAYWAPSKTPTDDVLAASVNLNDCIEQPAVHGAFMKLLDAITEHRREQVGDLAVAMAFPVKR